MAETDTIYEYREIIVIQDGEVKSDRRCVVKETPLTIMLNGKELASLVCSPHSLDYLAIGYLVNEGIIQKNEEIKSIKYQSGKGVIWVDTNNDEVNSEEIMRRSRLSFCGKGRPSKQSIENHDESLQISLNIRVSINAILDYIALLNKNAKIFKTTGGVHEAALAHGSEFIVYYEDISRHNVIDRILGYTFVHAIDTSDKKLVFSGRIASEMLMKAARIGVPIVVSRSAPTCLSIDMAEKLGITLIGFARGNNLNIYTHPERIVETATIDAIKKSNI